MAGIINHLVARSKNYFQHTLWREDGLKHGYAQRLLILCLRVVAITVQGVFTNQLLFRAAALSFYSLIGMGPMIAIVVMLSGFMLKSEDPALAAKTLNKIFTFIAPPVAEYNKISQPPPVPVQTLTQPVENVASQPNPGANILTDADIANRDAALTPELNDELNSLLTTMIESARSKTVGAFGLVVLIFIAIQLLTSVETTFNEIWGARRGRSWGERIVFYWTFISLGTMLGFGAIGLLSASAMAGIFNFLPFGTLLGKVFVLAGPLLSFAFILGLLMAFYKFFPNTTVNWKAALTGAFVTALLLVTNHLLSIVYVSKVIESRSFYGSLGIIPVLMLGLYIFWFFVLLGSQITYAVQNVNYVTNQQAWNNISMHVKELLSLAAFLQICRRFKDCARPYSVTELAERMHAPAHLLNESLTRLCDMGYLSLAMDRGKENNEVIRYQPARPLARLTFAELSTAIDEYGSNQGASYLYRSDPLIEWYRSRMDAVKDTQLSTKTLDQLLDDVPVK
ncbi:MAG: YihY/virulence factor BrkB family protein [Verrucomicrobiota bacterium]|nr:YihY/virulence factor BrkB family protein [Verrucomicrobiota bacterium]